MADQPYSAGDLDDPSQPDDLFIDRSTDSFSPDDLSSGPAWRPNGAYWVLYIFLQPGMFFRYFVVDASPLLTPFAALMLGVSEAVDRLGTEMLKDDLQDRPYRMDLFLDNWVSYWQFCLLVGVVAALFYFVVGGWWYRTRLSWSGAVEPDKKLADRVYLFSWQVAVIPSLIYAAWQTAHYSSPKVAANAEDWGGILIVLFLLWSVYTSYRGVRTAFQVRRWAARMWFLILPGGMYALMFAGLLVAILMLNPAILEIAPDMQNLARADEAGFSCEYPGNWIIDTEDEEDPGYELTLDSPDETARVMLWVERVVEQGNDDQADADGADNALKITTLPGKLMGAEAMEGTLAAIRDAGMSIENQTPEKSWGDYEGDGWRFATHDEDGTVLVWKLFVTRTPQGTLHVTEIVQDGSQARQGPGLELIRSSFKLKLASELRVSP